jgi:hypothetical protein
MKHFTSIALQPLFDSWIQWDVTQQQHTATATLIVTTKSTYRSPSAQRLSERTVEEQEYKQELCDVTSISILLQ